MSFLDLASSRYSCRAFTDEPVTQAELDQLLEAAESAHAIAQSVRDDADAGVFKGDLTGLIPVCVFVVSALVMAVCGLLLKKTGKRWIMDYALPISLILGMAAAIPITAWLS